MTRLPRPVIGVIAAVILLASVPARALPPVEQTVLENGLTLMVAEEHSLPAVTVQVMINAGSWRDPPEMPGLANLTAETLLLGTGSLAADAIFRRFESMGAEVTVACGRDAAVATLRSLTEHLAESFDLLMDCLLQPAFPQGEVQREIEAIAGRIQAEEDDPSAVARKAFMRTLYRSGPYGHPPEGTLKALARMTRRDIADFHADTYRAGRTYVAVVGDVTRETVEALLLPRLKAWPGAAEAAAEVDVRFLKESATLAENQEISQANILIGHGGIARHNGDYHAVTVMNHILGGGGFSSRLVQRIRVEEGLAYSVSSQFVARQYPGTFQVVLQTRNATAGRAMEIVLSEMERMRGEGVGAQELEMAKQYLIGSFPLQLVTQAGLAAFLCQAAFFDLGMDYPERYPGLIRAVSAEDVQRAARTYLHPDRVVRVIVGDLEEAGLEASMSQAEEGD